MINAIIPTIMDAGAVIPLGRAAATAQQPPSQPITRRNIEARFSFNEELAQIVVTLRDTDTGEVVRQIPPEKVLQFAAYLLRATGTILDTRA